MHPRWAQSSPKCLQGVAWYSGRRGTIFWMGGEFTEEWELVERLHHPVSGEHLAEVLALPLLLAGGAEREGVVFILLAGVGKRSDLGEDCRRSGAMPRLPLPCPPALLCNTTVPPTWQASGDTPCTMWDAPCWQTGELGRHVCTLRSRPTPGRPPATTARFVSAFS
jgi:hypothetical protein